MQRNFKAGQLVSENSDDTSRIPLLVCIPETDACAPDKVYLGTLTCWSNIICTEGHLQHVFSWQNSSWSYHIWRYIIKVYNTCIFHFHTTRTLPSKVQFIWNFGKLEQLNNKNLSPYNYAEKQNLVILTWYHCYVRSPTQCWCWPNHLEAIPAACPPAVY